MSGINRAALFRKLSRTGYEAAEAATVLCRKRGNPYVELIHWLFVLLARGDSDLHRILRHFAIDEARVARDFTQSIDELPRGSTSVSDFSPHLLEAAQQAWLWVTLGFGGQEIRSGHLVLALLANENLRHLFLRSSPELGKLRPEILREQFAAITAGSPEEVAAVAVTAPTTLAAPADDSALARYTVDLTERARQGALDRVVGRDEEIRQMIDILLRRRQNNPLLTGEAGVGKTAVVEGLALRIASGEVPPALSGVSLRTLDIGLLSAGAGVKGEFEKRLAALIDEVQASPKPIILFVDEAHTLIGAGGTAGTGDAANLLKPALARGTLRTIAATTWAEYKRHIEKDPALTRRFEVVKVAEPDAPRALLMMRGIAGALEGHHQVQVLDEALEAAVKLSQRYIPARQLPDKAVSLLDTTCARVAVSQNAVPAPVEDARRSLEAIATELGIIERERAVGIDVDERARAAGDRQTAERLRLAALEARWEEERTLVARILELRRLLRGPAAPDGNADWDADAARGELRELQARLSQRQADLPLILPTVDAQAVAAVVADWTGIPLGRMVESEADAVLRLATTLGERVIGQDHALAAIARRIQTSRAGLEDPNKPVGVFLLAGPSGVGKTETALALAEALYGGRDSLITINMSEYQEAHTVSSLKGAPPGYVGYGEGGVLTEAVRRRPYSVVLLDEVEKAHPDVHELFFQVFDKGQMEDGEGRFIDFRNTLILLTSNVGSDVIMKLTGRGSVEVPPEPLAEALRRPLLDVFPPALLGRLVTVPYRPLDDGRLGRIARLALARVGARLADRHRVPFTCSDEAVALLVSRCTELDSGGRMIDAILTNTLLPRISQELLARIGAAAALTEVAVTVRDGDFHYAFGDA